MEQGIKKDSILARNCQSAEENLFFHEDRDVVSEEKEVKKHQNTGDESPSSLEETNLEGKMIESLPAYCRNYKNMKRTLKAKNKKRVYS